MDRAQLLAALSQANANVRAVTGKLVRQWGWVTPAGFGFGAWGVGEYLAAMVLFSAAGLVFALRCAHWDTPRTGRKAIAIVAALVFTILLCCGVNIQRGIEPLSKTYAKWQENRKMPKEPRAGSQQGPPPVLTPLTAPPPATSTSSTPSVGTVVQSSAKRWTWEAIKPASKIGNTFGITVLITARKSISDMAFQVKCSVPCALSLGQSMAVDSASLFKILPSDPAEPSIVRIKVEIPNRLENGHQLAFYFISNDEREVGISWVRDYRVFHEAQEEVKPTQPASPIMLTAEFLSPASLGITISNPSGDVVENVDWSMIAFRTSDLCYFGFVTTDIGYIKPRSKSANYQMDLGKMSKVADGCDGQIREGDELTGSVSIDCPHCSIQTYIVHLVWKTSGWYFESDLKGGYIFPKEKTIEGRREYVQFLTSEQFASKRIEIMPQ
jgi:hypothetical protein